ncbi:MAG TPA: hypothetical protein VH682_25950 [Gemmataceae bacterium]|jgi:hypothetical protein
MYPHRIRLRGPWECQRTADSGRRFRRRFGYPGRLDVWERVWLTFSRVGGRAIVRLNDRLLGCHEDTASFEFEVTSLLQPRNELVLDVEEAAEALWGEVVMEIRCTAFLRGLRRFAVLRGERVELHVSGQVVGVADRPLELYVVLDRSTVAYQMVTPTVEGQPFAIVVPDLAAETWRGADGSFTGPLVKIDLVNGATSWYTSEEQVTFEKIGG